MSSFRNPAFTLLEYPPFTESPQTAQLGVLEQLDGRWVNAPGVYGCHTTILPAPGSSTEQIFGTFHFISEKYTEDLQFEKNINNGPVRNRLGSNEQFNGALNYKTNIINRDGAQIHFEVGQYLWLGVWSGEQGAKPYDNQPPCLFSRKATEQDVENNFTFPVLAAGAQGPQFVPPYSISRQGCIPHGNAIQLFGNQPLNAGIPFKDIPGGPDFEKDFGGLWPDGRISIDPTMGYSAKQLRIDTKNAPPRTKPDFASFPICCDPKNCDLTKELDPNSGQAYVQRIFNQTEDVKGQDCPEEMFPYSVQPNLILADANKGLDFISHDKFTLSMKQPEGHQGGSLNNVGVERYAKVVDMTLNMWISKIKAPSGKIVSQLQYEQIIHFEFQFGTNGGTTRWPHIQVNTLRRADELEG